MNYAHIKKSDIANGPGVRVSLFVSGCTHHCKGCFNPETWDFDYGQLFDDDVMDMILGYLSREYISGLSLLGGEPFEAENLPCLLTLVKKVKDNYPAKTIWCYTGYDFEKDIINVMGHKRSEVMPFLSYIDVIVDGEFVEEKKDLKLRFRGSSNQRMIDVQKSLAKGIVCLADEYYE
ncbi:MAG: anaerobic ribonucleoside-triphosphate reductase activating protein [Ruminococcus sp.]|nr:anaerobic ribonucleoside-triphosphate reductase activating protein [Ruminococcus sp.]